MFLPVRVKGEALCVYTHVTCSLCLKNQKDKKNIYNIIIRLLMSSNRLWRKGINLLYLCLRLKC